MIADLSRRPFQCILPPHILDQIARNGTEQERGASLGTLVRDITLRSQRMTAQLMQGNAKPALMAATDATPEITIYNDARTYKLPGQVVSSQTRPGTGAAEQEAFDGLDATFNFYWKVYQRNSIDNEGLHLDATVHFGENYNNAFWNGQQMVFGDGDGMIFDRFTIDLDIIGHELTHGVTGHEAGLTYLGQSGALNESISDVFGSLIRQWKNNETTAQADWLIGKSVVKLQDNAKGALRSVKEPGTAYDNRLMGRDPQPNHMKNYIGTSADNGGVHLNSGIPNRAFFLAADYLGGKAWERAGQIWYDTIRDPRLKQTASFSDFATRTIINAIQRYGRGSDEKLACIEAWSAVGVPVGSIEAA